LFQQIRQLSKNVTIYGLGDVAVSLVNFALLGLYVKFFDATDYGIIGMLGGLEVLAKIVFRFGLDGSFMRLFYDRDGPEDRRRLASTIFFFLLGLNGAVALVLLLAAPAIAAWLLGGAQYTAALRLMLINTFAIGFTFIPFHVLRMEDRSMTFSAITLARAVATIGLRLLLVAQLGLGITGLYLADVLVTAGILAVLWRWFAPLIAPTFSAQILREALRFGLPRVPHAAAQQVMAVGDKFLLQRFVSLDNVGIYSMAVSFGLVQKLFLSAFESAWAPFYYAATREADAGRVFRIVTTYGLAVLALLTAGLSAVGRLAAQAMTHGYLLAPDDPRWGDVETIIGFTALGVFLQGFYLLTSVGLNITKQTQFYPVATISAAVTNIALNLVLIPRFGLVGAAWANGAGYAVQAALGYVLSQRVYPVTYEWGRIARVCIAGIAAYGAAMMLPSIRLAVSARSSLAPLPDLLARGVTVVLVFVALLALLRVFRAGELRRLRMLGTRRPPVQPTSGSPQSTEQAGEIVAAGIEVPD